jgi:hypothetical protein
MFIELVFLIIGRMVSAMSFIVSACARKKQRRSKQTADECVENFCAQFLKRRKNFTLGFKVSRAGCNFFALYRHREQKRHAKRLSLACMKSLEMRKNREHDVTNKLEADRLQALKVHQLRCYCTRSLRTKPKKKNDHSQIIQQN